MLIGTIKDISVGDLSPWPRNYRVHPPEQLKRIAQSLSRNGQRKAIVVQKSTNRIIAGHGVWQVARDMGWETVRCDVVDFSDEQAAAFLVDDNELQRFAEDDEEVLAGLLDDLRGTDYESLSYDSDEIDALLGNIARAELEDPGPAEVPEEPTTKRGDLWQCGEHFILCGDCQTDLPALVTEAHADCERCSTRGRTGAILAIIILCSQSIPCGRFVCVRAIWPTEYSFSTGHSCGGH